MLFEFFVNMRKKIKKWVERVGDKLKRWWGSVATLGTSDKHNRQGFELFVKVEWGWPMVESVSNVIPNGLVVLKSVERFRYYIPDHLLMKRQIYQPFSWTSIGSDPPTTRVPQDPSCPPRRGLVQGWDGSSGFSATHLVQPFQTFRFLFLFPKTICFKMIQIFDWIIWSILVSPKMNNIGCGSHGHVR